MSETIYIKETREFMTENGCILKEDDLSAEEIAELKENCSNVNRLFGNTSDNSNILKG